MRGLEKNNMKKGTLHRRTLRLYERIGLRANSLKKGFLKAWFMENYVNSPVKENCCCIFNVPVTIYLPFNFLLLQIYSII